MGCVWTCVTQHLRAELADHRISVLPYPTPCRTGSTQRHRHGLSMFAQMSASVAQEEKDANLGELLQGLFKHAYFFVVPVLHALHPSLGGFALLSSCLSSCCFDGFFPGPPLCFFCTLKILHTRLQQPRSELTANQDFISQSLLEHAVGVMMGFLPEDGAWTLALFGILACAGLSEVDYFAAQGQRHRTHRSQP